LHLALGWLERRVRQPLDKEIMTRVIALH